MSDCREPRGGLFAPLEGVARIVPIVGEFAGPVMHAMIRAVLDSTIDPGTGKDLGVAIEHEWHGAAAFMS